MYSLGLIGYPLTHSISPKLHHAALEAMGILGEYRLYSIPPLPGGETGLIELLESLRAGVIHGLNVTIPHKQNLIAHVNELSPAARSIGALNTLYLQEARLCGDNTDAPGFRADLEAFIAGRISKHQDGRALVLGAGGSARAVIYALLESGWQVTVAARRLEQARELVAGFRSLGTGGQLSVSSDQLSVDNEQWSVANGRSSDARDRLSAITLDERGMDNVVAVVDLIVNATPVGMWPKIGESPWPDKVLLPQGAMVYDLVYNPPDTALMQSARDNGLVVRNGLGMLVEQAALALERWTSLPVPRQPMWDVVPEFFVDE